MHNRLDPGMLEVRVRRLERHNRCLTAVLLLVLGGSVAEASHFTAPSRKVQPSFISKAPAV